MYKILQLYILLPIPLWIYFHSELIILISAFNWYWIVGGVRKEQIEFFYKLSFYKIQLNKIKPSTMHSSLPLIYILPPLLACTMQFVYTQLIVLMIILFHFFKSFIFREHECRLKIDIFIVSNLGSNFWEHATLNYLRSEHKTRNSIWSRREESFIQHNIFESGYVE